MATSNAMSNYLENKVLTDNLTGGTKYIGLFSTNPTDANSGTEVTGGSYARQTIAFTVTLNQAKNNADVVFPTATAGWGNVTHYGIFDALAGNLLFHGALENGSNENTTYTINNGDTIKFLANSISITLE